MTSAGTPTDRALLDASRAGDVEAFGRFYARHRAPLLGYLARRVRDPEVAVDLMAEAFASALVAVLDRSRELPPTPVSWLFVIARNLLIDSARRGRVEAGARARLRLEPLVLDDEDLERVAEIAAASDLVRDIAAVLSDAEWEAFRARVLDEESYPSLARRLRCSEAVVRKRVSRARSRLRTAMEGSDG